VLRNWDDTNCVDMDRIIRIIEFINLMSATASAYLFIQISVCMMMTHAVTAYTIKE